MNRKHVPCCFGVLKIGANITHHERTKDILIIPEQIYLFFVLRIDEGSLDLVLTNDIFRQIFTAAV